MTNSDEALTLRIQKDDAFRALDTFFEKHHPFDSNDRVKEFRALEQAARTAMDAFCRAATDNSPKP